MNVLYIAWQDPQTRLWHTVGRLSKENGLYYFTYTQGAKTSPRFNYLGRMHDLHLRYVSNELFPLFANRVLSSSRPEYPSYVRWLAVDPEQPHNPMELLARSGGKRATDELCVYPHPDVNENGEIELFFLSHGLRYLEPLELQRVNSLRCDDKLLLREENNEKDRFALRLETNEPVKAGYCPRYLNKDLRRVLSKTDVHLTVERLNLDAPIQFRLLCRAVFTLPTGFGLFTGDEYIPLGKISVAA